MRVCRAPEGIRLVFLDALQILVADDPALVFPATASLLLCTNASLPAPLAVGVLALAEDLGCLLGRVLLFDRLPLDQRLQGGLDLVKSGEHSGDNFDAHVKTRVEIGSRHSCSICIFSFWGLLRISPRPPPRATVVYAKPIQPPSFFGCLTGRVE
jgi:hypothetical protein